MATKEALTVVKIAPTGDSYPVPAAPGFTV